MTTLTVAAFNRIIENELPLANALGLRVTEIETGRAVLRIPYDEGMLRPGGTIAGPVMMAAADAVMYAVVMSARDGAKEAVTSNLTIHFLRRPEPGDLTAEGRLLKLGRRLAVVEVTIASAGAGEAVAHVTGTYSIPPDGI